MSGEENGTVWRETNRDQRSITLGRDAFQLRIIVCSPTLIRVRMNQGTPLERRSWAVTPADGDWSVCDWSADSSITGLITINTSQLKIIVDQTEGSVSFADSHGAVFCADAQPASFGDKGVALNKIRAEGERFYGFGERTGLLEKTGHTYTSWTFDPEHTHSARVDNMYAAFPIYLALDGGRAYGVFFNTSFRSSFDIGAADPGLVGWRTDGPELDYYVAFGPAPADVLRGWTELLGSTPLPPRWALGYHQSRWGYDRDPVMRELAAEFRGRGLPCDAIHFDIDYMRGYRVFTWNPETFPDPARLLGDLAGDGFKVVTIIDPGVKTDPDYHVFREGLEQDRFIRRADGSLFSGYVWPDDSAFADYTRADVRAWWGEMQRPLLELGVRGIWDDMNEPTVFARPFSEGGGDPGTIDLDAPQGGDEPTTHAEVHNLYGLLMARATREGMLAARPDERPFVLTRSGFAGLQRWATLWTGDNSALWEHLEMTLPQIC
ncbi:MAG TPA: TIM-barrel domain-containing protein, partial [Herpetosiphonaceae bacterium]|nr:TIM-barrel domain-containing protein [Herpetosiphonaceae bacterium]